MNAEIRPIITPERYRTRRARVFERLGSGVMILAAAPTQYASRDTERRYVPDRELYYLSGLADPGTVLVLVGGDDRKIVVFARERDAEAELWAGPRPGPEAIGDRVGADGVHPVSSLADRLPELLRGADRLHYRVGKHAGIDRIVNEALERARARGPRTGTGPRGWIDPGEILDDLRLVKDDDEVAVIRRACEVTVAGHLAGAGVVAEGIGEWVIEAAVEGAFRSAGARGPGFPTIVGSGENACVLHYIENEDTVPPGALVLLDAGADVGLYHGDVTRTYPAAGSFSDAQRDIYHLVDRARIAAIEAVAPGVTMADVHAASVHTMVRGLVSLGVLSGDVEELVAESAHRSYFPHQTSHWLGLDVHDPGDYARGGTSRRLEPGMVFTVEPGLYFRPEVCEGAAVSFAGIGVRIEDDVLVTDDGHEVLTSAAPTEISEVEELVDARS